MSTTSKEPVDLLLGALREIGLTVLGLIGALTALFVFSRPLVADLEAALVRRGSTESIGDYLPAGDGSRGLLAGQATVGTNLDADRPPGDD